MTETVQLFNTLIAIGGMAAAGGAAVLLLDYITQQRLREVLESWGMVLALLVSSAATVMTLVYSEVFGFVPCGLCWLQRVFLYPLVILSGMALIYKDTIATRYGMALSISGLLVALYNHYVQMGGSALVACPQSGGDCTKRYLFEFGFVTFPLISAFVFAFLIVLFYYILKTKKQ